MASVCVCVCERERERERLSGQYGEDDHAHRRSACANDARRNSILAG